ncbi:MAG: 6-phosphogluconolactonase [Armatimonadetes bacterium]|nr:6-phosphogluconolactonase [Anaerolineae bacterium]
MAAYKLAVYATPDALAAAAAEQVIATAAEAIAARGRFTLALAGGSTPKAVYALLATQAARVDWGRVHLFWGDERTVPPDHPDSNYRMAYDALLHQVAGQCASINRMPGELPPAEAADRYEATLRAAFPEVALPRFDLVLLGLGEDAHTASLFPHTTGLGETTRWYVANFVPKLDTWRLTLTVPVINAAHAVTFWVAGQTKAAPLQQVLEGNPHQPDEYPAQRIQPTDGTLTFMVDAAANNLLT